MTDIENFIENTVRFNYAPKLDIETHMKIAVYYIHIYPFDFVSVIRQETEK